MKKEGDMMGPMLFALIGGSAGTIVSILLQVGLQSRRVYGGLAERCFRNGSRGDLGLRVYPSDPGARHPRNVHWQRNHAPLPDDCGWSEKTVRNHFSRGLLFVRVDLSVVHDSVLRWDDCRGVEYRAGDASAWRAPTRSIRARPRWRFCCQSSSAAVARCFLASLGGFSALSLLSQELKQFPMRLLWRDRSARGPDHELIWLAVSVASLAGSAAWLAMASALAEMPIPRDSPVCPA